MLTAIDLYDYVYSWKPYKKEAEFLHSYLSSHSLPGTSLIELACGTGRYIEHLSENWSCTGVDLCMESLAIANRRASSSKFVQADMKDISLSQKYDVAMCLFGGISYIDATSLSQTFSKWHQLLNEGGLLIIEPWREEETIHFDQPFLQSYHSGNFRLSRVVTPKKEEGTCVLDFYFLLATAGHKVQRFQQKEVLHLHAWDSLLAIIQENGFTLKDTVPSFLEDGTMWVFHK